MALGGCSAGPMIDRLPGEMGGLPAGAPARPATPYQYPAVHDMPPPRSTTPMSEEEQFKLEKELRRRPRPQQEESPKPSRRKSRAKKGKTVVARRKAAKKGLDRRCRPPAAQAGKTPKRRPRPSPSSRRLAPGLPRRP